ncbi:hypothetical protein ACFE04_019398 [Oxalis oulophora]
MGEDLRRESEKFGLSINLSKTKVLTNISEAFEVKLGQIPIESVNEYKYLGQTMSFGNRTKNEIKIRRAAAWKAFWAQRTCLKGKLGLRAKIRILESSVYPVLTYGAQTWAYTVKQLHKIESTQFSMLRSILGIRTRDKIRISEMLEKTHSKIISGQIKKLKFGYAGHVARESRLKLNRRLTFWVPNIGRRRVGRPLTRWVDEIIRVAGPDWSSKARNRKLWTSVSSTYAQMGGQGVESREDTSL